MEGTPSDLNAWQEVPQETEDAKIPLVRMYYELARAIEEVRTSYSGLEGRTAFEMILGLYQSHRQGGARVELPLVDRRHPLVAWRDER